MKCLICKNGETQGGFTAVTLQRGDHILVIKNVPADICENCGEYYLSQEIAELMYQQAEQALERGAEVEIGHFVLNSVVD